MTAPDLWPTKANVVEAAADGKGFWKSCSGCHESNEGHPTGPYHPALQCHVGGGCFECGGIGAVWDTTDYAAMGDYLARPAPLAEALAVPIDTRDRLPENPGLRSYEHVRCLIFVNGDWEIAMWNCEHLCWDDDDGDDFRYDPQKPSHWMPLPEPPALRAIGEGRA